VEWTACKQTGDLATDLIQKPKEDIRKFAPVRDISKEATIARVISLDGLSYHAISRSHDIKKYLSSRCLLVEI
jgi:hypothetical protein